MNLNFDYIFKIPVLSMKINQSHPDIPRNRKWFLYFIAMHGPFLGQFVLLLYSTIFHDLRHRDFTKVCCTVTFSVVAVFVTFLYAMMIKKQNLFLELIKTMKEDYKNATNLDYEEQLSLLNYANKGKWVCKLWLLLCAIAVSLFPLKSMLLMVYSKICGEFKLIPVYDMTFPAFIEARKEEGTMFVLMYIIFMWYGFYAASMFIAIIPLGPIFLTHACGQLEILKKRVNEIFSDGSNTYNSQEANDKLKCVIIKLQHIYRFVPLIDDTFRVMYEFCLKGCAVTLPITLYLVLESSKNGEFSLEFLSFIFISIALTGCPCYYGDLLFETGESFRQAVYESRWERHWDRRTRTTLLIMLIRCSRPVAIRSMFRTIRLDALTEVFRQAYAIFNLLNAVT